jgi:hypothetical protein
VAGLPPLCVGPAAAILRAVNPGALTTAVVGVLCAAHYVTATADAPTDVSTMNRPSNQRNRSDLVASAWRTRRRCTARERAPTSATADWASAPSSSAAHPCSRDAEGLFHAPSAVTASANARWTPHSGRGVWFVPRWRQAPISSRRCSTVEQSQHETSAPQECPDCHALAADLEAHKQWHSRLVHDIATAVDRDVKRRVGAQ